MSSGFIQPLLLVASPQIAIGLGAAFAGALAAFAVNWLIWSDSARDERDPGPDTH